MEHDSPSLLFRLACEHLRASQVVRDPGRGDAERTSRRGAGESGNGRPTTAWHTCSTDTRCSELGGLLVTDAASTGTYLLPAVAIVLGVLVLGETITGTILAGHCPRPGRSGADTPTTICQRWSLARPRTPEAATSPEL